MIQMVIFLVATAMADGGVLRVRLSGVKEGRGGPLLCALFRSEAGFPMEHQRAIEIQRAQKSAAGWECSFLNLRSGQYAVSVIHDQNGDGKMNTGKFGIPQEGWATSNNVVPGMRPPNFKESRIQFAGGEQSLTVNMHY